MEERNTSRRPRRVCRAREEGLIACPFRLLFADLKDATRRLGAWRSGHVVLQWDALPPLRGPAMFSPRRHGLGVTPVDGDTSGGDTQDCSAPSSHFRPIFSFDA